MGEEDSRRAEAVQIAADLARLFEGLRLKPYLCPAGIPTIGYGHTGPDVTLASDPITKERAEELLAADLAIYMRWALLRSPRLAIDDPQRLAAITDFNLNLGPTRYAASTLRRVVNAREWGRARDEIRKWVYGGGRILPGLVLRREAEAALL